MPNILILSGTHTGFEKLASLLSGLPDAKVETIHSAAEARERGDAWSCGLVVINPPLDDGTGFGFARRLALTSTAGVLLIVKKGADKDAYAGAGEAGAVILEKPFSRELFLSLARMCLATYRRMERLLERTHELEGRIEETRLVGRAKCVLIQYLNMTEPQAHRYIEKQSMDMRMSRERVARGILSAYEI